MGVSVGVGVSVAVRDSVGEGVSLAVGDSVAATPTLCVADRVGGGESPGVGEAVGSMEGARAAEGPSAPGPSDVAELTGGIAVGGPAPGSSPLMEGVSRAVGEPSRVARMSSAEAVRSQVGRGISSMSVASDGGTVGGRPVAGGAHSGTPGASLGASPEGASSTLSACGAGWDATGPGDPGRTMAASPEAITSMSCVGTGSTSPVERPPADGLDRNHIGIMNAAVSKAGVEDFGMWVMPAPL